MAVIYFKPEYAGTRPGGRAAFLWRQESSQRNTPAAPALRAAAFCIDGRKAMILLPSAKRLKYLQRTPVPS